MNFPSSITRPLNHSLPLPLKQSSAGAWWSRGIVGTEVEVKTQEIVMDWAKSIDGLSRSGGTSEENLPDSLWSLPDWAIDTFPTKQVFLSVQTHVERHFGMKLNEGITYNVAGILSSEEYISSSVSVEASSSSQPIGEGGEWKFTPNAPFQDNRTFNDTSVRIYLCLHVGKQPGDFFRFYNTRSLRSKENPLNAGGEISLQCPSWYSLMSWSDHKAQINMSKGSPDKQFWVIVLDASKVRRKVKFDDIELLECEQLVRESGYGSTFRFPLHAYILYSAIYVYFF